MNTHFGSLQKKGNRYYLVIRHDSRQQWIALRTGKLPLARFRAARIAPVDLDDEQSWLEHLVREGESARRQLVRLRAKCEVTWDNLFNYCNGTIDIGVSDENRASHGRWLRLLAHRAVVDKTCHTPGCLSSVMAKKIVKDLCRHYISAPRMVAYFRRVWSMVGLDQSIWPKPKVVVCVQNGMEHEHYRRLADAELAQIYVRASALSQPLADMFLLGYSTGLRLSDVAELEMSEISLPFLRVCPNKTRRSKPFPLKIPLTAEAQNVVDRLRQAAVERGRRYLFDDAFRSRPSRKFAAIFRSCGVVKSGSARASFHSLRATFISLMDDAGIPPHITDSITGHGGGGMHARYTQPSDGALMAAVSRAIRPLCRSC